MYNEQKQAEHTIRNILRRAEERGLHLTRDEVLEELQFSDEDTSVWSATVDQLILERGETDEDFS